MMSSAEFRRSQNTRSHLACGSAQSISCGESRASNSVRRKIYGHSDTNGLSARLEFHPDTEVRNLVWTRNLKNG